VTPAVPPLVRAFVYWQRAAGRYWQFVCATPFLCPVPPASIPMDWHVDPGLIGLINSIKGPRPAIFVDLALSRTLPATPALESLGFRVVPIIQRWPNAKAVLPSGPIQQELIACRSRHRASEADRGLIVLLDGERAGPEQGSASPDQLFDNTYPYVICRFPPVRLLHEDGVGATYLVSSAGVASDLSDYAGALEQAELALRVLRPAP
jgi:hypothetical protein